MERPVRHAWLLGALGACAIPPAQAPLQLAADASVVAVSAAAPGTTEAQAEQQLILTCGACHSLEYVRQQRLSTGQWTATLNKMRSWGAVLEASEVGPLAEALAARYGSGGPPLEPRLDEVAAFVEPRAPPRSAAALVNGRQLYSTRCLACHGRDARGATGVNLVDRQLLQEPARFSDIVRSGRGRMPPHPDLGDAQIQDLLAWLGTQ
jgi:mono/diheme cytochrome c family protein